MEQDDNVAAAPETDNVRRQLEQERRQQVADKLQQAKKELLQYVQTKTGYYSAQDSYHGNLIIPIMPTLEMINRQRRKRGEAVSAEAFLQVWGK
eukprot:tig00001234_g7736.t1